MAFALQTACEIGAPRGVLRTGRAIMRASAVTIASVLALAACNMSQTPSGEVWGPAFGEDASVTTTFAGFDGGLGISLPLPVAVGVIAPGTPQVHSAVPPVPINGGTLLVTKDGASAVAADPDRDRVLIVDLDVGKLSAEIALQAGDEPGRLVEDNAGRVHVVLRHAGELADIGLKERAVLGRRKLCPVPHGIAYDAAGDTLLVACTSGELLTLPAAGGAITRNVHVDLDLRDVVLVGGHVYVTRFKSAELLELDADGAVVSRRSPLPLQGQRLDIGGSRTLAAAVAWRTIATPDGRIVMLHQRAQVEPIALHSNASAAADGGAPDAATTSGVAPDAGVQGCGKQPCKMSPAALASGGVSAYGGGALCTSIVEPSVSMLDDQGSAAVSGPLLDRMTLAVDTAVTQDGSWLAVAAAGTSDGREQTKDGLGTANPPVSVLVVPVPSSPGPSGGTCLQPARTASVGAITAGQAIAVAYDLKGRLVIQTRDPNRIRVVDDPVSCGAGCAQTFSVDVDLGGAARRDTGHDLFHLNAGAGLACASCHPGGGDDGRAWNFAELGARRTQLFNMGIGKTLPLHWDGSLPTFPALVSEVFERRMGGAHLVSGQIQLLSQWIATLHPNRPLRAADDAAALRGRALFESSDVGCSGCHSGDMLTDNQTLDVGTGGAFQVPSLIGVAYHQPYIHDGCANTLHDRFDPSCGGALHGNTAALSQDQIADLVAYLESL
jgi:cytochrome c553